MPLILRRPFINTAKVVIDVDKRNMKMGTHNDEAFFDVSGTPEECMRVEFNLVVKKKTTKSSVWKLLDISSQSKGNIKNWMTIIFWNYSALKNLKEEELRPRQPIIFRELKSKNLFKGWRAKYSNLWVIKNVRDDGRIELKSLYARRIKTVTMDMLRPKVLQPWWSYLSGLGVKKTLVGRQPRILVYIFIFHLSWTNWLIWVLFWIV